MGFWLSLLSLGLFWSYRLFTRRLERVRPDLERLRSDPATTLAERTITIGPEKCWVTVVFVALLATFLSWFVIDMALMDWYELHRRDPVIDNALFIGVPPTLFTAYILL